METQYTVFWSLHQLWGADEVSWEVVIDKLLSYMLLFMVPKQVRDRLWLVPFDSQVLIFWILLWTLIPIQFFFLSYPSKKVCRWLACSWYALILQLHVSEQRHCLWWHLPYFILYFQWLLSQFLAFINISRYQG
jgi:hypothetical protein